MIINEDATKFMYVDNKSKTYFSRPWVAYATIQNNDEVYQCGGAIINEKYVSNNNVAIVQLPIFPRFLSFFPYTSCLHNDINST